MRVKLQDLLRQGEIVLKERKIEQYRNDAYCLLHKHFNVSRAQVLLSQEQDYPEALVLAYWADIRARGERRPLQHLLGNWEFMGLSFIVNPNVLIPRPETAELVELIVEENPNARRLLDIGTGSGCIAISLDKKLLDAEVEAWDISEEALAIARKNNDALEARVRFLQRDVLADDWEKIPSFDVIVSNPPYVTETEKNEMDANVLDWEPGLALFVPDEDPLRFYNRIARLGSELLLPGGKLYFEINQAYGRETAHILEMNQYRDVRVIRDIFGKDRIVTANR